MLDKLAAVVLWTKFIIPLTIFLLALIALISYVITAAGNVSGEQRKSGNTRYKNGLSLEHIIH